MGEESGDPTGLFFYDWWEMRVVILPVFFSVIDGRGDESGDPTGFFFCD